MPHSILKPLTLIKNSWQKCFPNSCSISTHNTTCSKPDNKPKVFTLATYIIELRQRLRVLDGVALDGVALALLTSLRTDTHCEDSNTAISEYKCKFFWAVWTRLSLTARKFFIRLETCSHPYTPPHHFPLYHWFLPSPPAKLQPCGFCRFFVTEGKKDCTNHLWHQEHLIQSRARGWAF